MMTLFLSLSLFVNMATAQDLANNGPVFMVVTETSDRTSNGSIVGRPTMSLDCGGVLIHTEAMKPEDIALLQANCLEAGEIEIRGREASGQQFVTSTDALGRYHRAIGEMEVAKIDANNRREVSMAGISQGVDVYGHGDMIATGHAAAWAAEFDNLPANMVGNNNGFAMGQSFGAFDAMRALNGSGGYAGGGLNGFPTPQHPPAPITNNTYVTKVTQSPATTTTATSSTTVRSDAEIMADDLARREADLVKAKAEAERIRTATTAKTQADTPK